MYRLSYESYTANSTLTARNDGRDVSESVILSAKLSNFCAGPEKHRN